MLTKFFFIHNAPHFPPSHLSSKSITNTFEAPAKASFQPKPKLAARNKIKIFICVMIYAFYRLPRNKLHKTCCIYFDTTILCAAIYRALIQKIIRFKFIFNFVCH